jgi:hypothetical protein
MLKVQLEQIAYAQGFAQARLEEAIPLASELPELQQKLQDTLEAFKILSQGYDRVRKENAAFEIKITMIRGALA